MGTSAAVVGALVVAFVWLMVRRPSDRSVAAFATTYGLTMTPGNVDQVRSYIQWTRRWRAGATVLVVGAAAATTAVLQREPFAWWLAVAVGYGGGTLIGELVRPVERRPGRVGASLEVRRVDHFVSRKWPWFVIGTMVVSLVPVVYLLIDNPLRPWNDGIDPANSAVQRPQDWYVASLAIVSVAATAIATYGARALARAPMPADSRDRMAARHAIRSAAIIAVFAAAVVISGAVASKLGNASVLLDADRSTLVQWTNNLAGIGGGLAALLGLVTTATTIPRRAPLEGRLPPVPRAETVAQR